MGREQSDRRAMEVWALKQQILRADPLLEGDGIRLGKFSSKEIRRLMGLPENARLTGIGSPEGRGLIRQVNRQGVTIGDEDRDAGSYQFTDEVRDATPPDTSGRELLARMGIIKRDPSGNPTGNPEMPDVPRFLNRVLSLPVPQQNAIFQRFADLFANAVETAKRQGTFDDGVEDLSNAEAVRMVRADLAHQAADGAQTWHYHLEVDEKTNPLSWADALRRRETRDQYDPIRSGRPSGWYKQARSGNIVLATNGGTHTDPQSGRTTRNYALSRPNGSYSHETAEEFDAHYVPVSEEEARRWWNEKYREVPKVHTRELHLIGGAILNFWDHLEQAGAHGMHVIRAQAEGGQRVVGVEIPNRAVANVLRALGVGRDLTDPREIFNALGQGAQFDLAGGLKLVPTKVHREDAYEVTGVSVDKFPTLERMGLISERIAGKRRWFVPTNAETGVPIVDQLLKQWPLMREATGGEPRQLHSLRATRVEGAQAARLRELFRTPEATASDSETKQGGPGLWISPQGKAIPLTGENGIATHGQTAMKLTGAKDAPTATNRLLREGYIRVRGGSIQTGQAPVSFDSRLSNALQAAKAGAPGQDIHIQTPEGIAVVPPHETGQFLANPQAYLHQSQLHSLRQMPGFYSQLERTIEAKMPEKAPVPQILGIIDNPQNGAKQDEVKWTGLREWLVQQKGPVTKPQVLDYLKANEVQVEEVVKGHSSPVPNPARIAALESELASAVEAARQADAAAATTAEVKEGDRVATVGSVGNRGGYVYSTGKIYEAKRRASDGQLLWKLVDSFGGTRSGRSERFIGELKAEAARRGLRWTGHAANNEWAVETGTDAAKEVEAARLHAEVKKLEIRLTHAKKPTGRSLEGGKPKFADANLKLPGGKNYRELLLTLRGGPAESELAAYLAREDGDIQNRMAVLSNTLSLDELLRSSEYGTLAARHDRLRQDIDDLNRQERESKNYRSSHWDEPNVLAHIRFNDRTDADGKRDLHVEEIQSDWHQQGRTKGYRPTGEEKAELERQLAHAKRAHTDAVDAVTDAKDKLQIVALADLRVASYSPEWQERLHEVTRLQRERDQAYTKARAIQEQLNHGVPVAPFSKTWHELAFRRILRWAAENGYDRLTWTTGAQQAERYDLKKHVSRVEYDPQQQRLAAWDKNGSQIGLPYKQIPPEEIQDYIGKEPAKQLLEAPMTKRAGEEITGRPAIHVLHTKDLAIGGEGMKGFYDQILPAYAAKLGKKWGAKVGKTEIKIGGPRIAGYDQIARVHSIDITPAMRESVMQGQPLFARKPTPSTQYPAPAEIATAQAQYRYGTVYANPAAVRLLQSLGDGEDWDATTLPPARAFQMRAKLAAMLRDYARSSLEETPEEAAVRALDRVFTAAQEANPTVVITEIAPHDTLDSIKAKLRHERMHVAQLKLGGVNEHIDWDQFLKHPLALQAGARLAREGYNPKDEPLIAAEIGAHLASGPEGWVRMGLSRDQARELYRIYVERLNTENADNVDAHLAHVHPFLRTIKYGPGSSNPQANAGVQGQPRGVRPGVRPAVSRTGDLFSPAESNAEAEAAARAKLEADRLTAEFNSPTRGKTRKPKTQPAPSLFEPTPEDEQNSLFSLRQPMRDAAQAIVETRDELQKVFHPQARPKAANAALELREQASLQARDYARADHALDKARAFFASRKWEDNLDFINRIEAGDPQPNEQLQAIADVMRELLDRYRDAVQDLGSGKLQSFYETYFPHMWERPNDAIDAFKLIFARRPIEGSKSFLKQRKFQSFQEGVDAGLKPISENPVDLVLGKIKEMSRYLLAHRWLNAEKRRGEVRYVPARKTNRAPRGWVQIADPIGTVWGNPRIPVKEALDKEMWEGLTKLAESLGVDHKRLAKMRGSKWGYAVGDSTVRTRFGGPESVLIHEIGHILDERYGMAATLVNTDPYKKELRALADEREDPTTSESYHRSVRGKHEKIANLVAAYVHNRQRFGRIAPRTFAWFDNFVRSRPELAPLSKLEYGMKLKTMRSEIDTGGLLIRGYWYAPQPVAQIISNYLSPGLQRYAAYRGLRAFANSTLQFALGFSGYHAGLTAYEAMVSRLATAIEAAAHGQGEKALANALNVPAAAASSLILGDKVIREYLEGSGVDPAMVRYVDALVKAGGRVQMDEQYRTRFRQQFMDAWRKSDVGGKVFQVAGHPVRDLAAIAEAAAWPVMEWLVPRQKVGAFAAMAERILAEDPDMGPDELRGKLAQAWDSIDNRFGQLVYDNMLWNRIAKDLAMISVQSVGWNMGTFREILGGIGDWIKYGFRGARYIGGRIARGGGGQPPSVTGEGGSEEPPAKPPLVPPQFTPRMAYVLALPALTALLGAIATYLMTGTPPRDWRDYFFPPIDASRRKRLSMIGYMKDVIHWAEHPVNAAVNKIHPWLRALVENIENRDWQNVQIWNAQEGPLKVAWDMAAHQFSTFTPYAWRNFWKERQEGESIGMQLAPQIGITSAPQYITQTAAEQRMGELAGENRGKAQTPEDAARSRARGELTRLLREGKYGTAFERAQKSLEAGNLTEKDLERALSAAQSDSGTVRFERLGVEQALEIYHLGTPAEKHAWLPILADKITRMGNRSPAQFEALREHWGRELEQAAADAQAYVQ